MILHVPVDPVFEEGGTLMLTCCVQADPSLQYAWIKTSGDMSLKAVGVNSPTLFIPEISEDDIGVYACLADGDGGTSQSDPIVTFLSTYGK